MQEARRLGRDEVLTPGHWEIAIPPGNYYVASVRNFGSRVAQSGPWYGFDAGAQTGDVVVSLFGPDCDDFGGYCHTRSNPVAGASHFFDECRHRAELDGPGGSHGQLFHREGCGTGEYTVYNSFDTDGPRSNSKFPDSVFVSEGGTAMYAVELIVP